MNELVGKQEAAYIKREKTPYEIGLERERRKIDKWAKRMGVVVSFIAGDGTKAPNGHRYMRDSHGSIVRTTEKKKHRGNFVKPQAKRHN